MAALVWFVVVLAGLLLGMGLVLANIQSFRWAGRTLLLFGAFLITISALRASVSDPLEKPAFAKSDLEF